MIDINGLWVLAQGKVVGDIAQAWAHTILFGVTGGVSLLGAALACWLYRRIEEDGWLAAGIVLGVLGGTFMLFAIVSYSAWVFASSAPDFQALNNLGQMIRGMGR